MLKYILCALIIPMTANPAVKIEKTSYKGWPNCYRITNGEVELIVTSDIGPRIMRYAFPGGQNIFKEYEDQLGKTGEKEFQLRGGHRLWVAPEHLGTTWALDNGPVNVTAKGDFLEARQPADSAGIEKTITVKLAPSGSAVEVRHLVRNTTAWDVEFAPWALTMMTPGGIAISGFPPRGTHPEDLLPTNPLVMWAYTDLSDKRWGFLKKYITLRQDPKISAPQKIGLFNEKTWAGYLLNGELFVKRTEAAAGKAYPDFGCSFETFTNHEMLEIETLGPLGRVASGESVEHVERWSLHKGVNVSSWTDAEVDRVILPLVGQ
ncbi:MAG: hypothetical protein KIT09_06040 [Bryobacteraceae bacterium]|nr:hypothetical protein [Bryobacteraceae bacterium]